MEAGINCGMMVGGQTPIPDFNQSNKDDAAAWCMKTEETKALGSSSSAPGDAELVSGVLEMSNVQSLEVKSGALEVEP